MTRPRATSERSTRNRAALVAAARKVFERDGFLNARLMDITAEARLATGTFYTYFQSKEEVFAAVLAEVESEMLHPGLGHVAAEDDPIAIVEESNRAYLTTYVRHGRLMELMTQVAWIDPQFMELRRRRAQKFLDRTARRIAELQSRGLADPGLDPDTAAMAVCGSTSRVAMDALVQANCDFELVLTTLNLLWVRTLQLQRPTQPVPTAPPVPRRGRLSKPARLTQPGS